jgi:hypothetical protein
MHDPTLDRREFTRLSLLSMLSGVVITVSGCGGGGGGGGNGNPNNPNPPTTGGDKLGSIAGNHGHVARITAAELTAGGALTVSLTVSTSGVEHTHTVSLSAAEVVSIRDGARVAKTSTVADAHDHIVTFNG